MYGSWGFAHVIHLGYMTSLLGKGCCGRSTYIRGPGRGKRMARSAPSIFLPLSFYKHQVARCTIPSHTAFFPSLRLRVPEPRPWQRLDSLLPLVPPRGPTQLPPLKLTSTRVLASSPATLKELVASCPSRPNSSPRLPPKSASLSQQENLSSSPSCAPLSTL